jgi:hypothetical protein
VDEICRRRWKEAIIRVNHAVLSEYVDEYWRGVKADHDTLNSNINAEFWVSFGLRWDLKKELGGIVRCAGI